MKRRKHTSRFAAKAVKWTVLLSVASLAFISISNCSHKSGQKHSAELKAELDLQLDSIINALYPRAKIEAVGEDETNELNKESLPSFSKVQELEMSLETLLLVEGMNSAVIEKTKNDLTAAKEDLKKEEESLTRGVTQTIRRVNIIHPDGSHTAFYQRKRSDKNQSDIIGIINY